MEVKTITMGTSTGNSRLTLPKAYYEKLKALILAEVIENEEVTLQYLMDEVNVKFTTEMGARAIWYFLDVKKDLVKHQLIKISFTIDRVQFIRLKPYAKRIVKNWLKHYNDDSVRT